jgi:hypothetical protein
MSLAAPGVTIRPPSDDEDVGRARLTDFIAVIQEDCVVEPGGFRLVDRERCVGVCAGDLAPYRDARVWHPAPRGDCATDSVGVRVSGHGGAGQRESV